ncbi:F0F1 ATP synthase subunit delta [Spiribacter sp. 2438]|uniref:F0F1 ATP synthase subunit delta n=1 Tax=Spiribacter sp. 2438 TaxID=2666185 RepID=UPI0012AF66A0|nr:F0F1 ATP synthase subunit delta [Spiribacter sp. 2438]QGM22450.1 F0F1 ATP synthase subunit delta [Spiribacter sp. 2438]
MAQSITVARPYAEAAFQVALDADDLAGWSAGLERAAEAVSHESVDQVLRSPKVEPADKASLLIEIGGEALPAKLQNLIRLLTERGRILVLPEINRQFQSLRETHEGTLEAKVVSAQPLDDEARQRLAKALSEQLNREVRLDTEIDETLIGGAIVRAGDLVIDGSVRGQLTRLTGALSR